MSAREVIAGALQQWGLRDSSSRMAQHAIDQILSAGYAILSPDEVRGIRDLAVWALDEVGCDVQLTPGLDTTLKALEARDG